MKEGIFQCRFKTIITLRIWHEKHKFFWWHGHYKIRKILLTKIWHKLTLGGQFHLIWGMWRSSFFKFFWRGQPSNPGGKSLDSIELECNNHDVSTWRWSWDFRPTFAGQSSVENSFIYLKPGISIARTKYHSAYHKSYINEQEGGSNKKFKTKCHNKRQ